MTNVLRLVRHALHRYRGLMIAGSTILFLLQILMALVARSFERSGQFSQLANFIPEFIRPFLDPSFMASLSFSGMVSFGYSHPIVLIFMIAQAIAAATEPVGEVESKFVDLLMARPLARGMAIARSLLVVGLLTLVAVGSMVLGSWAGMAFVAPDAVQGPGARTILSLAINLWLLILAWGAIALAAGSFVTRRATAATITAILAFSTFILDFLGRLWDVMAPFALLSPFHYYAPLPLIIGKPLELNDIVVLVSIATAASCLALIAWSRRDL